MIDDSNIPGFKERLEIRYDHRPALRHSFDKLGFLQFHRMAECRFHGRPPGLDLENATGVALCLELGFPTKRQKTEGCRIRRVLGPIRRQPIETWNSCRDLGAFDMNRPSRILHRGFS